MEYLDELTLRDLSGMTALPDLSGLVSLENLTIHDNPDLTSLAGLSTLEKVRTDAIVSLNPGLCASEVAAFFEAVDVEGSTHTDSNDDGC